MRHTRSGRTQPFHNPTSRDSRQLRFVKVAACFGMLAVFLLTAKANRFWHSMSARSADLHHITLVGVFVAFVVLAVRWVWAADSEMALWVDWLNNPPLKPKSYLAIASLSITLA